MQSQLAKVVVELGLDIARFSAGVKQATNSLNALERNFLGFSRNVLAGLTLVEVGRQVIEVTSKFEKFEAVLTNTLGSNSKAQIALDNIVEFARTTPYQVDEITSAYIRWANLGLTPTIDKMGMLGDVAASLGAGFEETAEAFKDLMVGQTKRIENIGISAQMSNGKIQLSFKGVNIEIEKNAQGVMKALETYSKLNGVQGTSAAIMETLGGKISNLKDTWDIFLKTLGEKGSPIMSWAISQLTELLSVASQFDIYTGAAIKMTTGKLNMASPKELNFLLKQGYADFFETKSIPEALKSITSRTAQEQLKDTNKTYKDFKTSLEGIGMTVENINPLFRQHIDNLAASTYEAMKNTHQLEVDKLVAQEKAKADALILELERKIADAKERKAFQEEKEAERKKYLLFLNAQEEAARQQELASYQQLINAIKQYRAAKGSAFIDTFGTLGEQKKITPQAPEGFNSWNSYINSLDPLTAKVIEKTAMMEEAFKSAAVNGIQAFAESLYDLDKGKFTFGQAILKGISIFAKQFGQFVIATAIAAKQLGEAIRNAITSPQAAVVAIAAGAALIALGSYAGAQAQKMAKTDLSSSSRNFSNNIQVTGTLTGNGRDLVAVINNTSFDNTIRRGG